MLIINKVAIFAQINQAVVTALPFLLSGGDGKEGGGEGGEGGSRKIKWMIFIQEAYYAIALATHHSNFCFRYNFRRRLTADMQTSVADL